MKENKDTGFSFKPTELLKEKAVELIRETESLNYVEGIRLGRALGGVFAREHDRLLKKHGGDHPRTKEAALRLEMGMAARKAIHRRFTDVSTPRPDAGTGWAVDGFVRTADGDPVAGVTVAAYDRQKRWYRDLGYSCTDEKGYFKMIAEKIPDKEMRVYMLASKGEKILKSNENRLTPVAGTANRIDIIIDAGGKGDCMPPPGDKAETPPVAQTVPRKDTPAKEAKDTTPTPAKTADDAKPAPTPAKAADDAKPAEAVAVEMKTNVRGESPAGSAAPKEQAVKAAKTAARPVSKKPAAKAPKAAAKLPPKKRGKK